ncbi:threonine efflux protein [Mesorhizobium tianshanense]|uniref:Threonine/homoserine/homoserine lactone efflux protein n=1 Tax=Mesorhizobium tianshanense TaxID=39844 RepID=A0A562MHZ9_9HYPH|nr:LysE family translocator [Mesorhizobium tianshanense]TWI19506.1 threonine/homoserine/homoserine lactone efflux protein [Mesorhizobium tianshanense]GLS35101.1 threonine efflux protein [Mesorhizobium tianshanense]
MLLANIQHLLLVYTAYLIAVASPGPSTMAIMGVAMNQGRAAAVALAFGVVTGSMFWAVLAATGISTILTAYAEAIFAIKIAGGLYLLYLAYKSAKSALSADTRQTKAAPFTKKATLYRRGVLLHLSNPKAVLGWIAIMSLGLRPDAPSSTFQAIIVGCAILGILINVGYALIFSTALMGRTYQKSRCWIEGTLAAIFGYAGIHLLLSKP